MNTTARLPRSPADGKLASRLLKQPISVLGAELDQVTGNRLCTQLLLLCAQDPRRDVSLWINSPSCSVPAILAITDAMRIVPSVVSTLTMGLACSTGQFLLSAGTPGKHSALPHARILLHQGGTWISGTAVDIAIQPQGLRHTQDTAPGSLAEHTGQPLERIVADSQRDRWSTAKETVAYRFADRVIARLDDVRPHTATTAAAGRGTSNYPVPYVVERTPNGERRMDVFS